LITAAIFELSTTVSLGPKIVDVLALDTRMKVR
jgi:hypothetical protein